MNLRRLVPSRLPVLAGLALLGLLSGSPALAQGAPGEVLSEQRISSLFGGFTGQLDPLDEFGTACAPLGDLDGDGVMDLLVGAWGDDDGDPPGAQDRGAVYVLFLDTDGTVKSHQKISDTAGGFTAVLDDFDRFGHSMKRIGDLTGDGTLEVAISAVFDDDGGENHGAVYIVSLNTDGTVASHTKISSTSGGFTGSLDPGDLFGHSVAPIADLDGDGIPELAVGADGDDDGGTSGITSNTGSFYILFLASDGTVKSHQKVSKTSGGFTGDVHDIDSFGHTIASLGDLDGDGLPDLAVGAPGDDDGASGDDPGGTGAQYGAVWILFLNVDGTVKAHQKISATSGGFTGVLDGDRFTESIGVVGDLDGDGVVDIAVGEFLDDDGGTQGADSNTGAEWILFLNTDGTVKSQTKISATTGGFGGILLDGDRLGHATAPLGDLDGDGRLDLAVGAPGAVDGGALSGAVFVLFLDAGVWTDLRNGLAGTSGTPVLDGVGSLVAGDAVTLSVSNALPLATTGLVIGLTDINASFKGGVLVPAPDVLVLGLLTDGSGTLTLPGLWPPGLPSDATLFMQCWIADPATPAGFSATNALSATTP
ncbi:MAG: integrin alpha [Planctomycetota bacterium]|jgi:hypothetical protein